MPIAVVLGGTAGVGRAVVDALVERGYRVGVAARGHDRLQEVAESHGDRVATVAMDAADAASVESAAQTLVDELGAPDVWINCAMATVFSPFRQMSPEEFERVVAVTLGVQVNGTRAALQHMTKGKIICIGSGLGYRSVPLQSAYCAAKHALNGFVSSVRSELIHEESDVTIHLVQLPAINTPQFDWARSRLSQRPQPAPPAYAPEFAAKAVLKAIDNGPRELLVGQSVLKLTFGQMVLPNWLDRKLADDGVEQQKSERPPHESSSDNLFEPADYPSRAEGSYGDRSESDGWIVDGDLARKVLFFGAPGVAFLLGLVLG